MWLSIAENLQPSESAVVGQTGRTPATYSFSNSPLLPFLRLRHIREKLWANDSPVPLNGFDSPTSLTVGNCDL